MLFVHQSFVKQVSVLKRVGGRRGFSCLEDGAGSDGEAAGGGAAARVDARPPAECPINLRMQSIRQTAD